MKKLITTIVILMTGLLCHAQTIQQAESLHQRGREFVNDGKIAQGRECTRQAMEIRKKLLGEMSEDYITSLNYYALTFGITGEYAKAVELEEQVIAPYNGKPLSEQFEVFRLSSTKELCYKHNKVKPTKAAMYGDINYNEKAAIDETTKKALDALRKAEGLDVLDYTKQEIDGIESILKNKSMKEVKMFRDVEASKEVFLELNGSSVNILHIATHGMYKDNKQSTDAESMDNSMLAFANAAMDSTNFVTAAKIATMNLHQCDLAVLSACETGLGKLGGDGVFGLQRGFKNAGVHTLLMSLKNVYDNSTAALMISLST